MINYVWIHHGKKETAPEQLTYEMRQNGLRAVCFCGSFGELNPGDMCQLTFEELLLDERYTENGIVIEEELLRMAGGINRRLTAKQEYELVLRVSECADVYGMVFRDAVHVLAEIEQGVANKDDEVAECADLLAAGFMTDAYVAGRYYQLLREKGLAESVLMALLEEGSLCESPEWAQRFLEEMLSHGAVYQRIYRGTQPILIYLGVTYCYNILNVFAKEFARALEGLGERIVYYDTEKDDVSRLSELVNGQYKASIGFQTWIMSVRWGEGKGYVQDLIGGPKYDFVVDHPIWLKEQLEQVPDQFYVLTHDRDYQDFIRRHFPGVRDTFRLPPGGRKCVLEAVEGERTQAITFLGTYGDYRKKLEVIRQCVPSVRWLAARYLGIMRKRPDLTAENAFREALSGSGISLKEKEFLELFFEMKAVIQAIMYYYREKVVETILNAGMEVHVYGESWQESPFRTQPKLHIHPAVTAEQGMEVLQRSKISLNVMAWHKDGFTERIADSMIAGAVVVSDRSRRLEEDFSEEVVLFELTNLSELQGKLRFLLEHEEEREKYAKRARQKALNCVTWETRARTFLNFVEEAES